MPELNKEVFSSRNDVVKSTNTIDDPVVLFVDDPIDTFDGNDYFEFDDGIFNYADLPFVEHSLSDATQTTTSEQPTYRIILDEPGNGKPQALLTTDFWQWSYSVPRDLDPSQEGDQNPFTDTTGEFADVNQSGPVFFLTGALFIPEDGDPTDSAITRDISLSGEEIFFPVLNVEWDNTQLQAFFTTDDFTLPTLTDDELRRLNEINMETTKDMFLEVDGDTIFSNADWLVMNNQGEEVFNELLEPYRLVTPNEKGFNYRIPENNVLGIELEQTDNGQGLMKNAMSDGIWVNLDLDPGEHELSFGGTFDFENIYMDLDGNGAIDSGKEQIYQDIFETFGTFDLAVNYNITQLG